MNEVPVDACEHVASRLRLVGDEVHLWWGRRDAVESLDTLRGSLSEDERRRSERFRRERDAHAFAFRRAFLRATLAGHLGCRPRDIGFTLGEFGKPTLANPCADVCFSAAGTGDWALVAVSAGRELGADVEGDALTLDARLGEAEELSRLARSVLTDSEQAELACLAQSERARAFLGAWTRKEALLKALGTGLSREPRTVEVGLAPLVAPRVLGPTLFPTDGAWLFDLAAPRGLVASLVVVARKGERPHLRPHGL
ncbi:MAG: 4'-phosphopantetheinyl transferase superfamily protein [Planctomycetes bacterium]|nr:4'-phosphopantetheinyl transferase superfamily protein [Planctomycetota bacterium]